MGACFSTEVHATYLKNIEDTQLLLAWNRFVLFLRSGGAGVEERPIRDRVTLSVLEAVLGERFGKT